ncbi:MAG: hypothetical protein IT270_09910 [Saprospiraceae bacterium]|nr:hypothetical protein [Saprospiraceae bacterium]
MKIKFLLFSFLLLQTGLFSQNNNVVVSFEHRVGGQTLTPGETQFNIWNGKAVRIDRAQFYLAELTLKQMDGTWMPVPDFYILADASKPNELHTAAGSYNVQEIQAVGFGVGIDQAHNHLDPTLYPAGHPLAIGDPSMHWGWAGGYRFLVVEGKIDNNNDGVPESTFEYHCLGDELYETSRFAGNVQAQNGTLHINLLLDYTQLFENMAFSGNLIQHGSTSQNAAMLNNAHTTLFFTLAQSSASHDVAANSQSLEAAPNPSAGETWISYDLPVKGDVSLMLINNAGQLVNTINALPASGKTLLNTAGLSAGVYQYAFYHGGVLVARKALMVR